LDAKAKNVGAALAVGRDIRLIRYILEETLR